MTTDESPQPNEAELRRLQEEETKLNCPDEYNLLSANASIENLESVEALRNTKSDATGTGHNSHEGTQRESNP